MSNSSNNSNFMSTLSSIAYEQLTGNKPSGVSLGLHPSNSSSIGFQVTTGSITPTSNSNGTSHWAAGMASAGDVLGNLGMGSTMDLIDSGCNTTWDIPVPPHGSYGSTVQRDLLTGIKDVLPDTKSRNRTKMNSSSAPQHSCRSSGDRRVPSNTSSTVNTRSRGSMNTNIINNDITVCLPNTSSISSKLTPSAMKAEGIAGALSCATLFIGDDVIGVPNFLSCSEPQDKTHHDCISTLTSSDVALIAGEHCDLKASDDKTYREQSKRQDQSLVKLSGSNKPTSSIMTAVHESCASSPSSNSNSLTKRKSQHAEEIPDSKDMTNSSPYFHLTRNGLDQLEVLSDSGDSLSPDALTEHTGDVGDGSSDGSPIADLDVGSMVEIIIREEPRFGVIRWLGKIPGDKKDGRLVAGVELEDGTDGLSDGTFDGRRHFRCPPGKAIFVSLSMCRQDSRFLESLASSNSRASIAFGSEDHGPVTGSVPPPSGCTVLHMVGRNKGIQGHQNSCYLDATLFSMFAFTSVFDSLLFRPATSSDIPEYSEVQRVLREHIVNPLRSRRFVRADRIMRLRTMLDHLSSVRGLTTEEKDPEEFLHSLLAQILKAEPFLQLSSGQEAYHYQLFLDKDDRMALPSVQHLFDQSFLTSDIKLKQVPSILILQMPRFGKDYKMYPRILPSLLLDVTDVIENCEGAGAS